MSAIKNYLSLVKFSHTIFAMPFAMIGFFLGIRKFDQVTGFFSQTNYTFPISNDITGFPKTFTEVVTRFVLVVLCMVTARSAAMAFNRWLDKSFDAKNPRTAIREIPAGIISANNALMFVVFNCVAFIILTWFINKVCFFLSPVIAAGFIAGFGLLYWLGLCVFVGMLIYQHSIVKPNDLRRVNLAFMTANGIASVVFAVFVIADLYFK
jgi:4-hydroxybenzoate polyprenyltransferase